MEEMIEHLIEHPYNEDREEVAALFFEECKTLRRLCIGRPLLGFFQLFEPTRDADGSVTGAKLVDEYVDPPPGGHIIEWDNDSWPKVMTLSHQHSRF